MKDKYAKKFKYLEHTADVKFQAFGKRLEEVFENCALAMFNAMYDGKTNTIKGTRGNIKRKIQADGKDYENLLYNFLEELLVLFDSEGFFLKGVKKLKISGKISGGKLGNRKKLKTGSDGLKLKAEVIGGNAEDYEIHIDVKAITYNEMFVREEKKGKWVSQVVLDV